MNIETTVERIKKSIAVERIIFQIMIIKNNILSDIEITNNYDIEFNKKYGTYDKWTDKRLLIYLKNIFEENIQSTYTKDTHEYHLVDMIGLLDKFNKIDSEIKENLFSFGYVEKLEQKCIISFRKDKFYVDGNYQHIKLISEILTICFPNKETTKIDGERLDIPSLAIFDIEIGHVLFSIKYSEEVIDRGILIMNQIYQPVNEKQRNKIDVVIKTSDNMLFVDKGVYVWKSKEEYEILPQLNILITNKFPITLKLVERSLLRLGFGILLKIAKDVSKNTEYKIYEHLKDYLMIDNTISLEEKEYL